MKKNIDTCKECWKKIDANSALCPYCGFNMEERRDLLRQKREEHEKFKFLSQIIGATLTITAFYFGYLYFFKDDSLLNFIILIVTGFPGYFLLSLDDGGIRAQPIRTETQSLPTCPQCNSSNIVANKKGYGAIKGLAGAVVVGPLGLLGGFHKSRSLRITCLNCSHSWNLKKK